MFTGRRYGGRWDDIAAVDRDDALVGPLESRDQPQRRRLPAAGRPEQREELAPDDREVESVDRRDLGEPARDASQLDVVGRTHQ